MQMALLFRKKGILILLCGCFFVLYFFLLVGDFLIDYILIKTTVFKQLS